MHNLKAYLLAVAAIILSLAGMASATNLTVPPRDGYVTDTANQLTADQEKRLEATLSGLHERQGKDVAVLIVTSLKSVGAVAIDDLGYETGNAWGVGDEKLDNGVLLTIALTDHKLRIDTGKGAEGDLTDSECKDIVDLVIAPHFKKGKFFEGIDAGVGAIAHELSPNDPAARVPKKKSTNGWKIFIVALLVVIVLILVWIFEDGSPGGSGRYRSGGGGIFSGGFGSSSNDGNSGFGGGGFGGGGGGGGW